MTIDGTSGPRPTSRWASAMPGTVAGRVGIDEAESWRIRVTPEPDRQRVLASTVPCVNAR